VALLTAPVGGWPAGAGDAPAAAGWRGASLGPLVLRAETAAIAAVAAIVGGWMV
jgi:16S rRNA (uracil1498-N3)-methyltransferase